MVLFTRIIQLIILISVIFASYDGADAPVKYKYVGCYEDAHIGDIHLFSKRVKISEDLVSLENPNPCVDECVNGKYSYAGIIKKECYCSHDYASTILKTSDQECNPQWLHKFPQLQQNPLKRLAVYETGIVATDPKPAKIYIGCYRDDNRDHRLLKGSWQQLKDNSPTVCHSLCLKTGFRYFGMTYKEECFCGDTRPSEEVLANESYCDLPCPGNPSTKCGGGWILSVYATGVIDVPSDNRYIGCYKNSEEERSLIYDYNIILKKPNSPRRCVSLCDQKGYKYAGVQNRDECYCSNAIPPSSFIDSNKYCVTIKCPGDATEYCGGRLHIRMYRTPKEKEYVPAAVEYLGCYEDQIENPILRESKLPIPYSLTPQLCIDTCQQRGFPFAGVKYGKYCLCDYYFPSALSKAVENSCKTPCSGASDQFCGGPSRLAAYYTGLPRNGILPSNIYLGCYRDDDRDNRMLKGSWQEIDNNTPRVCQKLCYNTGYAYFGLTWIKECFCGDESPSDDLLLEETECNVPCGGDANFKCGGGWRTSIYKTGLTTLPINNKYVGCYNDELGTALLIDVTITLSRLNSPQKCWNLCNQLGYKYAGVERGVECHCGDLRPDNSNRVSDDNCNVRCPGDTTETCGKQYKMRVFSTDVPGNVTYGQMSVLPPLIIEPLPNTVKCVDSSEIMALSLSEIQKLVYGEHLRLIRLKIDAESLLLRQLNTSLFKEEQFSTLNQSDFLILTP